MKKSILAIVAVITMVMANVTLTLGQVKHSITLGNQHGVSYGLDSTLDVHVGDTVEFVNGIVYGKFQFTTNTPVITGAGSIITYINPGDTIKTFVLTDSTTTQTIQVWFKTDLTVYANVTLHYLPTVVTGITEKSNKVNTNIIKVYPNPTTGTLNFTEIVKNVEVYNTNGQLVLSETNTNKIEINFSNGVYIVRTLSDNGTVNTNRIQVIN